MEQSVRIEIGCNYHTKWQSNRQMRFILKEIDGDKALLATRKTNKCFWCDIKDLIFIETNYNNSKAKRLKT